MALNDADKIKICYHGIESADYDNGIQREAIQRSDDFYFGRLPGAAATGRSQSVSMDVQNTITATQASIMESFAGSSIAKFEPTSDGDDQQAELESLAVSQAIDDAGGYAVIGGALDSALRYTNCCVKAWIDNRPETVTQRLPGATKTEAAQVVAQFPDEFKPQMNRLRSSAGTFESGYRITISKPHSRLDIEVVDLARIRVRKDYPDLDIADIDFFCIEHTDSRADMIAMGFDAAIVNALPKGQQGAFFTQESTRSKLQGEEQSYVDAADNSMDLICWYECFVKLPDGEGGTRTRLALSDKQLLDEAPVSFWPVLLGAAYPQAHRWQGIGLGSKIEPTQVSKTEMLRQFEDNLEANNNPEKLCHEINMDDAMSGRINGRIRALAPNARYEPVPVQDLGDASIKGLQLMDQVRSEAGGAALDLESPDAQLMDSQIGAVASQQVLGNQEIRSVFIARNIAETVIKPLYRIVHQLLREDFNGTLTVRKADQYVEVNPAEWQPRTRLTLTAGLAPSQRQRKASNLFTVIQTQLGLQQAGSPLVDVNGLHAALQAWGFAVDLPINQFFTDPESPTGQQAMQQAQQGQQMQQQMAAQVEQIPLMLEKMKQAGSQASDQLQAQVDVFSAVLKSEVEEAKLVMQGLQAADQAEIDTAQANTPTNGSGQPAQG